MDTERQGEIERERTINPQNELIVSGGSVYRFAYHTAYPIHTSDRIVFHNLALNACHTIPKTSRRLLCDTEYFARGSLVADGYDHKHAQ